MTFLWLTWPLVPIAHVRSTSVGRARLVAWRCDWLREKLAVKVDRAGTFPSRIKRAKDEGHLCGSREAKLFMMPEAIHDAVGMR
jgi:hypothetical protein